MTTAAASATPSGLPGSNGQCGYQHGMAPCLPMQGRECCSINGFCGSNETYCFVSNGCQYGCVDPASYYTVSTSVLTLSSTQSSTLAQTTTTNTVATTSLPTSKSTTTNVPTSTAKPSGPTGGHKTGAIVGGAVGGAVVFAILALCLFCWRNSRRKKRAAPAGALADAPRRDPETTQASTPEEVLADPALILRAGSTPQYGGDRRDQRGA